MTTVHLIRHGVHDLVNRTLCGRMPGVGLNEAGRRQAAAAAEILKVADPPQRVLTSPQDRTRQTAAVIAAALDLPMETEDALDEIDFGHWTGRDFAELDPLAEWRFWNAERHQARPPNGESMLEVQSRLSKWLQAVGRSEASCIAAVSHADVIKAVVALALGLSLQRHDRFDVLPGSITTLRVEADHLKLLRLNEVPYG